VGAFTMIHSILPIGAYSFLAAATLVNQDILPYSKTSAPRLTEVYGANRLGLERRGLSTDDMKDWNRRFAC